VEVFMTRCFVFLGLGGVGVLVASCSSKSADQQYSSDFADAVCNPMAPCCTANGFTFDKGNCEIGAAAFVQSGNDAAKQAGAVFDQQSADACIAAIKQLAQSCKAGADDPTLSAPCSHVWSGTKPAGTACSSDLECAPGSGRGACVTNVCVVLTSGAKIGDTCASSAPPPPSLADCAASGLQCDALGTKTCIDRTAIGASCGPLTTCVSGAFCDTSTNKCAATLAQGTACTSNGQCTSNACISNQCANNDLGTSKPCNGT
jgi:hypothetical protein